MVVSRKAPSLRDELRPRRRLFGVLVLGLSAAIALFAEGPSAPAARGAGPATDAGGRAAPVPCGLWRGSLDKRDVAVTLRPGAAPDSMTGRYAYLHIGKAIPLAGNRHGSDLALEERGASGGKPSGTWTLAPAAGGGDALTGTWSAPDGKRSAIIELTCLGDTSGKLRDPWQAANLPGKTTDEQFDAFVRNPEVPDKVRDGEEGTRVQEVTLLAANDPYELVDRHPFPKAAADVNAAIRARVSRARKEERQCLAEGLRCEITVNVSLAFLSPRFATVAVTGYYDGGGAHPDDDIEIWVFQMTERGARRINMERIYDLKTPRGRYKPGFWKLVRAKKHADPELDADCPDDQDDITVQLSVASDGIDVDVSYTAHAIATCGYSTVLNVDQLARFLRHDAPEVFRTGKF
jgi:hypothetical protein